MSDVANGPSANWLDQVALQGGSPPLLIVADNRSISVLAQAWHEQFSSAGWAYRVRLGEVPEPWWGREAAAIAAEAAGFQARVILAVGSDPLLAVARKAAEQAGLPLVHVSTT
ncbi:MAG: hypothetical protein ACO3NZ_01565 [Pirellulales bacterium]